MPSQKSQSPRVLHRASPTCNRRTFLKGLGTAAAVSAAASLVTSPTTDAQEPETHKTFLPMVRATFVDEPLPEVILFNRAAYGPRPGDLERVRTIGYEAYVEEQLYPTNDDPVADQKLAEALVTVDRDEQPISYLEASAPELWKLRSRSFADQIRPAEEVRAATWLRAVYSKWQLREVLVGFWHNHFNVNIDTFPVVALMLPPYDQIMRRHCLGNFRAFLEDVARSTAMQYYLDAHLSNNTLPNENYARELFELHTLGSDNYFNTLYDEWQDVPGALDEPPAPLGYIDEDVYEAARAFTGWTIADGKQVVEGVRLPATGDFYYYAPWHDRFQKRVLGVAFDSDDLPEADGKRVLDLVAFHPATARYLCTKLCRRLVADEPSPELIDEATQVWIEQQEADDQIRQVVEVILLSHEFRSTWGLKVKTPFELAVSFLRATSSNFTYSDSLARTFPRTGYFLYNWPEPKGHPDIRSFWVNTNVLLQNWSLLQSLVAPWFEGAAFDWEGQMPVSIHTVRHIVDFWLERFLARKVSPLLYAELLELMTLPIEEGGQPISPDEPPPGRVPGADEVARNDYRKRLEIMILTIAMSPYFQWR